jgi:hypothetical protein
MLSEVVVLFMMDVWPRDVAKRGKRATTKDVVAKDGKLRLMHQQHSWYFVVKAVTDMQTCSRPAQQRVEQEGGRKKRRAGDGVRSLGWKRA